MKSLAQARLKRARALELIAEGKSYDEVAQAVGYAHRGSAHKAVFKALNEREVQGVDELRRLEVDRLDALQHALWANALGGDLDAAHAVLRIIELRARLLGLMTKKSAEKTGNTSPAYLVVGPREGNPKEATMDQVYEWSRESVSKEPRHERMTASGMVGHSSFVTRCGRTASSCDS